MSAEISIVRLYLLRALYLMNFVFLGSGVFSTLAGHEGAWDPVKGAAFCLWGTLALLSGVGLRYPLAMLPVLLFQLIYKGLWLALIALPHWPAFESLRITDVMLIGFAVDLIVIPWPYVFASFVRKAGDRWR